MLETKTVSFYEVNGFQYDQRLLGYYLEGWELTNEEESDNFYTWTLTRDIEEENEGGSC